MAEQKSQFKNTSGHVIGVVQMSPKGEPAGIPLFPEDTIWLSEQEQALTANAPRHDEDNPFGNGQLTILVKASDVPTSRPIGDAQDVSAPPAAPEQPVEEMEEVRVEQGPEPEEPLKPIETGSAGEPVGEPDEKETPNEAAADTSKDRGAGVRPSTSPVGAPPFEPGPPKKLAD